MLSTPSTQTRKKVKHFIIASTQSTPRTRARKHVKHASTPDTEARKHAKHISTQARKHAKHVNTQSTPRMRFSRLGFPFNGCIDAYKLETYLEPRQRSMTTLLTIFCRKTPL